MFGWDDIKGAASNLFHHATELAPEAAAHAPGPAPLDPAEVARHHDQDLAAQELASRFKIDDDATHAHANNVVTSEDFRHIAEMYSDIRTGHSDLRLAGTEMLADPHDPAALRELEKFKQGAMNDIADILQTGSGRELLHSLIDSRDENGEKVMTTIGRTPSGNPGDAVTTFDGVNANAVHYEPGKDATEGLNLPGHVYNDDLTLRSDVTLYHELVHSYHNMRGDNSPEAADELGFEAHEDHDHWLHPENAGMEYQAVGMGDMKNLNRFSENTYRDERKEIGRSNIGERAGDDHMMQRLFYNFTI